MTCSISSVVAATAPAAAFARTWQFSNMWRISKRKCSILSDLLDDRNALKNWAREREEQGESQLIQLLDEKQKPTTCILYICTSSSRVGRKEPPVETRATREKRTRIIFFFFFFAFRSLRSWRSSTFVSLFYYSFPFLRFFIVVRAVDVEGRQQRERQALHPMLSYEFSIWKWARREEEEEPHLYRHVVSCFAFSIAVSSPLHPFLPPLCLLPITYVTRMLKCGLCRL